MLCLFVGKIHHIAIYEWCSNYVITLYFIDISVDLRERNLV